MTSGHAPLNAQRGGFAIGFVIGLLVGLVLALAVALYVTKVPVPFVNKVPQRTAEQDAAEAERNKNWDPNSGLAGKPVARPASAASTPPLPAATAMPAPAVTTPVPPGRDPAVILGDKPAVTPSTSAAVAPDPFLYFVQAGAYSRPEDAEQQRARLAMLGLEAKLSEREQGGRTMYRVRIGPFDRKDDAEAAKDKLQSGGVDAALVRVQK